MRSERVSAASSAPSATDRPTSSARAAATQAMLPLACQPRPQVSPTSQQADEREAEPGPEQLVRQAPAACWSAALPEPVAQAAVAQFTAHGPGTGGHGQNVQQRGNHWSPKTVVVARHVEQADQLRGSGSMVTRAACADSPRLARADNSTPAESVPAAVRTSRWIRPECAQLRVVQKRDVAHVALFHIARKVARDHHDA